MVSKAVILKIRLPLFSLRQPESFQVSSSLPVPSPSTLVGSLAYAFAINDKLDSKTALEYVRRIVLVARASLAEYMPIIPNPILLWRFRILDRGIEKPKERVSPEKRFTLLNRLSMLVKEDKYNEVKNLVETKLKDALYREYLFTFEINVIFLLREEVETKIFYYISRLGDTESLCSVHNIDIKGYNIELVKNVVTKYPFKYTNKINNIHGDFMILRQGDEYRNLSLFVIPVSRKIITTSRGSKIVVYAPSQIKVTFTDQVRTARIDNEYIILT